MVLPTLINSKNNIDEPILFIDFLFSICRETGKVPLRRKSSTQSQVQESGVVLGCRARVNSTRIYWVRACIGGVLAELAVFAVVFPARSLFGQRAFLASILVASAVMPSLLALWVCKRVESRLYLTWSTRRYRRGAVLSGPSVGQPQPLLYRIAHGLKVVGGVTGGVLASRRKTPGLRSL